MAPPVPPDEGEIILGILGPLLTEAGSAARRQAALAKPSTKKVPAWDALDQLLEALIARVRPDRPKTGTFARATTTTQIAPPPVPATAAPAPTPSASRTPTKVPTAPPPPIPMPLEAKVSATPAPPPSLTGATDELDVALVRVQETVRVLRPGTKPLMSAEDLAGPTIPARSGTAPETYLLYDDIVMLSGLNDWDGVLITLERLLVLARLEDHVKEFVAANEVKLLSIYETFLKAFSRVPRRLPPALENQMPRAFLRAEKIALVLPFVDGAATITDIFKKSPFSPLETCSVLCQLRRSGVIEI